MTKRFIFGGTTEGRRLAEQYLADGDEVVVCVASAYGRQLLPRGAQCYDCPMDAGEMMAIVKKHAPAELIDATHPFAIHVTENIRSCTEALGIGYKRILRASDEDADFCECVQWVDSAEEAAKNLSREEGPILLTTGSHTLSVYGKQIEAKRLYVRVLPTVEAIRACESAGILPGHIIAMQGPFTAALNAALYGQFSIRHIVSKDSGDIGGVKEKVLPALKLGLNVILIRRPTKE